MAFKEPEFKGTWFCSSSGFPRRALWWVGLEQNHKQWVGIQPTWKIVTASSAERKQKDGCWREQWPGNASLLPQTERLLLICSFCFPIRDRDTETQRDRDREYIISFFLGIVLWFWANNWLAFPRVNTCWLILLVEEPGWGLRYTFALSLVWGAGQVAGDHPLDKPFSTLSHPRCSVRTYFVMTLWLSWNKIDSINYRPHTQF